MSFADQQFDFGDGTAEVGPIQPVEEDMKNLSKEAAQDGGAILSSTENASEEASDLDEGAQVIGNIDLPSVQEALKDLRAEK